MSQPFIAEIRMFSFSFAPRGWAQCNGQILSIQQNQALFALLGTTYGGNGVTTFALPDLRSRAPVHAGTLLGGSNYVLGQRAGEESHTLTANEVPMHLHFVNGTSDNATVTGPLGNLLAASTQDPYVANPPAASKVALNAATLPSFGGSQAHENRQPSLTVNFCIALNGVFPSRN